jgi:hypothetical protein
VSLDTVSVCSDNQVSSSKSIKAFISSHFLFMMLTASKNPACNDFRSHDGTDHTNNARTRPHLLAQFASGFSKQELRSRRFPPSFAGIFLGRSGASEVYWICNSNKRKHTRIHRQNCQTKSRGHTCRRSGSDFSYMEKTRQDLKNRSSLIIMLLTENSILHHPA